jgi:hypothetical protein
MNWIDLKADTIMAALKYPGSISLVFASHKRPGGGYQNHERGQEVTYKELYRTVYETSKEHKEPVMISRVLSGYDFIGAELK